MDVERAIKSRLKSITPRRVKLMVKAALGRDLVEAGSIPAACTSEAPIAPPPPPLPTRVLLDGDVRAEKTTPAAAAATVYPPPPKDEATDRRMGTRTPYRGPGGALLTLTAAVDADGMRARASDIAALSAMYCAHRFDLLGSGWVRVAHGERYGGCEGHRYGPGDAVRAHGADGPGDWLASVVDAKNLDGARAAWAIAAESGPAGYTPIDWQVDFKSGYRWREDAWSRSCVYGTLPGVDVKLPWELSRMMHLPTLALAYGLAVRGERGFADAEMYRREFCGQVMDWIATNAPRFGVNWSCTMDVGIRVANLVFARDLFIGFGASLGDDVERALLDCVYEHAAHIIHHFEWFPGLRSNHYLANIAGLVYAASALPSTPQTDAWLSLGLQELGSEALIQFHADGSNFEGSTCYHRLSAEMLIWTAARSLAIPAARLAACAEIGLDAQRWIPVGADVGGRAGPLLRPGSLRMRSIDTADGGVLTVFGEMFWSRAERAAGFTRSIGKSLDDGRVEVPQIGDMDSGRWQAAVPAVRYASVSDIAGRYANAAAAGLDPDEVVPVCDHLDHRHLVDAAAGLFAHDGCDDATGVDRVLTAAVAGRRGDIGLPRSVRRGEARVAYAAADGMPRGRRWLIASRLDVARLERAFFEDFGLFVWRNAEGFYLAVRCGHTGQLGNGGHAHNDALHLEVVVDGRAMSRDPGTYLYTPVPAARDAYRSVRSHFVPRVSDAEPGDFDRGLFTMGDQARAEVLHLDATRFVGRYRQGAAVVWRSLELTAEGVWVEDASEGGRLIDFIDVDRESGVWRGWAAPVPFSPGYGVREAALGEGVSMPLFGGGRVKGAGS